MTRRTERIGEEIRAELARLLVAEATDPRLRLVSLTRVEVAPDLSLAQIHWSAMPAPDAPPLEAVGEALQRAAAFLRRGLARGLQLRRTPELRFRHDPSLELGDRTLATLRALEGETEEQG